MTSPETTYDTAIIGAGNIGIAVAYYLATRHKVTRLVIIDAAEPMTFTSAQSGENYRNWWPHLVMTDFTDHSITLLEEISRGTGNRINMTRRGYVLATRRTDPADLIQDLHRGYGATAGDLVRMHTPGSANHYRPPTSSDWQTAPDGVDILTGQALIRTHFPSFAPDIATVIHIRRAGDLSAQQLGQFMLERIKDAGGRLQRGRVVAIEADHGFTLRLQGLEGTASIRADRVVNAAGPFAAEIAAMLGEDLPLSTVFQQKVTFEDRSGAIPRDMPFSIDLDGQSIPWTEEERAELAADATAAFLLQPMQGGIHCRPEGGLHGTWIRVGWGYNRTASDPNAEPPLDPHFPDIVLRAASRLNPSLSRYIGHLPRGASHYGGYYTMTPENWPLIGPLRTPGAFLAGGLSGFGIMGACATGSLAAAHIAGGALPGYAAALSLARYADRALMAELRSGDRGIL